MDFAFRWTKKEMEFPIVATEVTRGRVSLMFPFEHEVNHKG